MSEWQEGGHAGSRKRHRIEVVPAVGGDLAKCHLSRRIPEALDDIRHRGELRLVRPLPGRVESEFRGEVVEPVGVKRLGRPNSLVSPVPFSGGGARAQRQPLLAQTLGC